MTIAGALTMTGFDRDARSLTSLMACSATDGAERIGARGRLAGSRGVCSHGQLLHVAKHFRCRGLPAAALMYVCSLGMIEAARRSSELTV